MPAADQHADNATLIVAITASSVAFVAAFNFGAFGTVFFDAALAVWVLSTVVLVLSFVTSAGPKHTWERLALLLPTVWFLVDVLAVHGAVAANDAFIDVLALASTVVALPFLGLVLVRALNPAFLGLPLRNKGIVVGVVVAVAAAGAFIGARNDLFLTCDDFKVSGNDQPGNCRSEPDESEVRSLAPPCVIVIAALAEGDQAGSCRWTQWERLISQIVAPKIPTESGMTKSSQRTG